MSEESFSESQATATESAAPEAATSETEAPAPPPAEASGGQAEVAGHTEAPEPQALDIDQYGNHLVPIKVDGKVEMVPLSEATNGYQRQADYTRSKQQLRRAEAIQTALESDPQRALRLLAEEYGVGEFQPQAPQMPRQENPMDGPPADPTVQVLQSQVMDLLTEKANREIDATVGRLTEKYGEIVNPDELFDAAMRTDVRSASDLERVFRDLAFDKVFAQAQAREQYQQNVSSEDAARTAAVEQLQGLVSSGNGSNASDPPVAPVINDIDDAVALAKQQLGLV